MKDITASLSTNSHRATASDIPEAVAESEATTPADVGKVAWSNLKAALAHGFSEDFMIDWRDQPTVDQ